MDRTSPTLVTDDTDLVGFDACAICTARTRIIDGPAVLFAHPSRVVCARCIDAIKTATA